LVVGLAGAAGEFDSLRGPFDGLLEITGFGVGGGEGVEVTRRDVFLGLSVACWQMLKRNGTTV